MAAHLYMTNTSDRSCEREDILPLLQLEQTGDGRFLTRRYDLNQQARIFGGQLLAQSAAAAAGLAEGRAPTYLHGLFLRGAVAGEPIEYCVESLQHGKRFSSFHVRGTQQDRAVIDALVSFQVREEGAGHARHLTETIAPPEQCPSMEALEQLHAGPLAERNYRLLQKTTLEIRLVDPDDFLFKPATRPRIAYWVKVRCALPEDALHKSLATIYLSDYFAGFCVMTPHRPMVGARNEVYLASLNHTIWLHEPCDPNDWLLAVTDSPHAGSGRGLATGHFYRRDGSLVATIAQACSVTARQPDAGG